MQLRPRNPESPLRCSIPVKAICDYRQIEVRPFLTYCISKKIFLEILMLYLNSFRLPSTKMMSVFWPITLIGPSGKSSTQLGTRQWFPPFALLCHHLTKRLLKWQQSEIHGYMYHFLYVFFYLKQVVILTFPFLQNRAAVSERLGFVAPLPHQHEECGVLALSDGRHTCNPQLECGLGTFIYPIPL